MEQNIALELKNITKTFGSVVANKNVSLTVNKGEILSILGENGSGKTTLMNMVSGIYYPDSGQMFIDGEEVVISSPKDAFEHNNFARLPELTAFEDRVDAMKDDLTSKHYTRLAEGSCSVTHKVTVLPS